MYKIVRVGIGRVNETDKCLDEELVQGAGFRSLDNWDDFWGRCDLYMRDGLHPNWKGTDTIAGRFASAMRFKLD